MRRILERLGFDVAARRPPSLCESDTMLRSDLLVVGTVQDENRSVDTQWPLIELAL